jgi:futalosine hydrolase
MFILITAATAPEIQATADFMDALDYDYKGHQFELLVTGAGILPTCCRLLPYIQKRKPDLVIQAGIAGRFNTALRIGEVVVVATDTLGDTGAEENGRFQTLFDLHLADPDEKPYTAGWLPNRHSILTELPHRNVRAVTVSKISDSHTQKQQLENKFHADIESMEGAAFHFVCLEENIPFLQLRSISNDVGERDKTKWSMQEAIHNLNEALLNLFETSL